MNVNSVRENISTSRENGNRRKFEIAGGDDGTAHRGPPQERGGDCG